MDLISREDLLKQIDEDSKGHQGAYGDMWEFLDTIAKMPTIESRPKGKWEAENDWHKCSNCGEYADYITAGGGCENLSNYCPNCGAEMESE